jgi:hypothetical protein
LGLYFLFKSTILENRINILDRWKKHFDYLSSPLNIRPKLKREHVDFIYSSLSQIFGKEFFDISIIDEISKNQLHFIRALLTKYDVPGYYKLFEFCFLMDYAKEKNTVTYQRGLLNKYNSSKLNEVIFEVYIDFIFFKNNIPYDSNLQRGNQIVEGYCQINGKQILVECKKKYSIVSKDLEVKSYLISEILRIMSMAKYGFESIGVLQFKNAKTESSDLHSLLKQFKNLMVNRVDNLGFKIETHKIFFELKAMNEIDLIELANGLKEHSAYFTTTNLNSIDENGLNKFRIQVIFNTIYSKEQAGNRLIDTIRKARKQHISDSSIPRIFFIDNEFLNDFSAPLLREGDEYYIKRIKDYLLLKKTKDIVILIFRNFIQTTPQITASVICNIDFGV